MKFGLLHFRVFKTDGVSLEMDKWAYALKNLGHEVIYISGENISRKDHIYIEELFYNAEYNKKIHDNAFKKLIDFESEKALLKYIYNKAEAIEKKLTSIIINNKIDVLIPNNVSSLGFNLPVGIAIGNINKKNICKFIYHHHDFYFERERYSSPIFVSISKILETYFPYNGDAIHCTINEIAKNEIKKRKGINAIVVPNVFDFNQNQWIKDEYNKDLRAKLDITDEDIVFLQATRIVRRKGIELGYYILEEFLNILKTKNGTELYNGRKISSNTKIHFVLAGLNEYEYNFHNLDALLNRSDIVIHYINNIIDHNRKNINNVKIYSLWDAYTISDFITYTSIIEGWGNQLLEGLFAKKPMLVYEYPVFKSDIKKYGFDLITFDDKLIYDENTKLLKLNNDAKIIAAEKIFEILSNKNMYYKVVNKNFDIAKKYLSYESLTIIISELVNKS